MHKLKIISLGLYPAALCSCGKWGFACTAKPRETIEDKRRLLNQAFEEHLASQNVIMLATDEGWKEWAA